jgi:hypothetical protein
VDAETKKPYTFLIEPSLLAALKAVQQRDGISISEQIRRALRVWLESKGVKTERKRAVTRKRS